MFIMFDINLIVYILIILYMYYMYHALYNNLILHSTILRFYKFLYYMWYIDYICYIWYTYRSLYIKTQSAFVFSFPYPGEQPVFLQFPYNISNAHVIYFLFILYITYYTYLYYSNRTGTTLSHDYYDLFFILLQDDHYDQIALFFSGIYDISIILMIRIMYIIHM